MNLTALPSLPVVPQTGVWYRAVNPIYYPAAALKMGYTRTVASRFSSGALAVPSFEILYLARTPQIALYEVEALYGPVTRPVPNLRAITIFAVEVQLSHLADLTRPEVQQLLHTSTQELTGNWRVYSVNAALSSLPPPTAAPTQALGAALFAAGVEGFLTPSAKDPQAASLIVFPERLQAQSFVRHVEPTTNRVYSL